MQKKLKPRFRAFWQGYKKKTTNGLQSMAQVVIIVFVNRMNPKIFWQMFYSYCHHENVPFNNGTVGKNIFQE